MTAPMSATAQARLALWGPRLIVALTVAALVLVGMDAVGPLRQTTTALAVLVAPGLAASLAMGPMSIAARALVAVVASVALLTVVSMVMALLGSSSNTTGLWVSALVALALILVPFLRTGRGDAPRPLVVDDAEVPRESRSEPPEEGRSGAGADLRDRPDEGGEDE